MNDETGNSYEDAGIGDVEGRPRMRERDVEIEQREIDHVAVEETVGQVAHDSAEQEGQRNIPQRVAGFCSAKEKRKDKNEREAGENDKK